MKNKKIIILKNDIDLRYTKIPENFKMPEECGNVYLSCATIPENFKMPEICGKIFK